MDKNRICKGLIIGVIFGILQIILLPLLKSELNSVFTIGTALTFWGAVGIVVATTNINVKSPITKGILIALLLNLPWILYFADIGLNNLLLPLAIMSVVFGGGIGYIDSKYNKK